MLSFVSELIGGVEGGKNIGAKAAAIAVISILVCVCMDCDSMKCKNKKRYLVRILFGT